MGRSRIVAFLAIGALVLAGFGWIFNYFLKPEFFTPKDISEVGIAQEAVAPARPEASESSQVALPQTKILSPVPQVYQTFNNCGPATFSMILGNFGKNVSQKELADLMRPFQNPQGDNDDKTIFSAEFATYTKKFGLETRMGPAGDIELLKEIIATAEIPVVVKGWLKINEDIGHFWIVRGYDEQQKILVTDDSYHGPGRKTKYADFLQLWQPFNYGYIIVYPENKKEVIEKILVKRSSTQDQYRQAAERAQKEIELNPQNIYPHFNLSTSSYYLGDYQKSVDVFEKIESKLPRRMLWYQVEPVLAYQKLENFDKVFQITDKILAGGNRAFSEFYQVRGEIFLALGKRDLARAEFGKALFYNKNFEPARQALREI